jgi:integrase
VRFKLIPSNPAKRVNPPKIKQDEITPLDSEQARALLDAGKGDRLEALYVHSLTVGLRIGEALGLKWSNIDLYTGTLRVNRQLQWYTSEGLVFSEPKHGSRRTVDLPQRTVEALRSHRKRQVERRRKRRSQASRRPQSVRSGTGYSKEVKNMAQAPESWIGETVDVAFYQQANRSGELLEVNDDGIVLEEVSERDGELTLHTFYPWNTLNYVRKEVRSAEGITPRRRGT